MSSSQHGKLKFTWMEWSGSLGDLGLFIPLVVAMTITCDLNIGIVLILAGLMNIITGLFFHQPIPVQPMKAIAAVVITEGLLHSELIAAGIIMGVLLIVISKYINEFSRWIPKPVVRGIQLGIGLKLAAKGAGWIGELSFIGLDSMLVAVAVIIFLLISINKSKPALMYIFLGGLLIIYLKQPEVFSMPPISLPVFAFTWPNQSAWSGGLLKGALPQLPLTVLNSVVALCALSSEYFPQRGVQPRKIAASIGLMNLISVPLGGIPMCHGSGGLAAQYRFGARTGGSVIILGILKIFIGILFGGALIGLLQVYPMAVLGPMLAFAGIELARTSQDVLRSSKGLVIALVTAACVIGLNIWVGFLAGSLIATAASIQSRSKK